MTNTSTLEPETADMLDRIGLPIEVYVLSSEHGEVGTSRIWTFHGAKSWVQHNTVHSILRYHQDKLKPEVVAGLQEYLGLPMDAHLGGGTVAFARITNAADKGHGPPDGFLR